MTDSIMALPPPASMPVDARGRCEGGPVRRAVGTRRAITAGRRGCGRRAEPALGVDQEGALGGDLLAGRQPLQHGEAIADPAAEDDLAALEDTRLGLDVDDLLAPGVDDRRL